MFNYASTNRKGRTNAKNATLGMVKMALKMSPITIIIFFLACIIYNKVSTENAQGHVQADLSLCHSGKE